MFGTIYRIVGIVIFLSFVVSAIIVVRKIRQASRTLFGVPNFIQGVNQAADRAAETPKSVSSMTRLMEPQIKKDFPDFVWEQFKTKAENLLISVLNAIAFSDITKLDKDASEDVRTKVQNKINTNQASNYREHFYDITIYQTEISNYVKRNGKCIITIQSAVSYYHFVEKYNQLVSGDKNRLCQTKYNMELVYIQDEELANRMGAGNAIGLNCPNCGAPIKNLGAKFCEFCGLGITPVNTKVWSLHDIREVDYHHV